MHGKRQRNSDHCFKAIYESHNASFEIHRKYSYFLMLENRRSLGFDREEWNPEIKDVDIRVNGS